MASRYSIEGIFSLIDKVTKPLNQIEKNSNAVSRRIQRDFVAAQRRLDNLGRAIGKWSKRAALAATAAATAWVGLGVRNAIKLADTMAAIGSNANITGPPLERLQSRLTDVANQAGIAVNELAGIANTSIGLGVASDAAADFAGVVARTGKGNRYRQRYGCCGYYQRACRLRQKRGRGEPHRWHTGQCEQARQDIVQRACIFNEICHTYSGFVRRAGGGSVCGGNGVDGRRRDNQGIDAGHGQGVKRHKNPQRKRRRSCPASWH